jgi:hypothetical protein
VNGVLTDSHLGCLSLRAQVGTLYGPAFEIPVSRSGLPPSFAEGYGRASVMARGGGGEAMFETDDDRKAFLSRLGRCAGATVGGSMPGC